MQKVLQINTCTYGSTGKIMQGIAEAAEAAGYSCSVSVPQGRHYKPVSARTLLIGNRIAEDLHLILGYFSGLSGCFSVLSTLSFFRKIKKEQIHVLHLHNLHNCYINIPLLFQFIRKRNIRVIWTLHDCWSFTGHCPYFTMVKCDKWKQAYSAFPGVRIQNTNNRQLPRLPRFPA